jgi:hypothetical protein
MLHVRVLNAGLPNAMGGYDEKPEDMRERSFFKNEWLNMVGGCCGSTSSYQGHPWCGEMPRKLPMWAALRCGCLDWRT